MIDSRETLIVRLLQPVGSALPLRTLSEKIGVSILEMESLLESLAQAGFAFDRTGGAVRLVIEPDSLVPQTIMARLDTTIIGREVLVFRETSSTNDVARQAGIGGADEGIVFFAQQQTAGRGTHGREWISQPNEGLWFSILLRSQLPVERCPLLIQMAAIAAAYTVELWSAKPAVVKARKHLFLDVGRLCGSVCVPSNG